MSLTREGVLLAFALCAFAAAARADSHRPNAPECKMGVDGVQACGYNCKEGVDGHMVCGSTPGATCAQGIDGRIACGYNCQMGVDGVVACANTPDGVCAVGVDGRVACSQLLPQVGPTRNTPAADCRMGTDGRQVCGHDSVTASAPAPAQAVYRWTDDEGGHVTNDPDAVPKGVQAIRSEGDKIGEGSSDRTTKSLRSPPVRSKVPPAKPGAAHPASPSEPRREKSTPAVKPSPTKAPDTLVQ
jgi:hypothetical protein